jgi:perosamine synthetase
VGFLAHAGRGSVVTIPWWEPALGAEEIARVTAVIEEGFPNDGALTDEFATRIAKLCGVDYGIGVSSGSAALYCALVAAGVRHGDEVVVPDLTFIATANAVRLAGADPVLADVRREDFTLDVDAVAAAITPRTRAILPVHVNGRGGSIREICAVAAERGLLVVEDAAEALGSAHDRRALGSFGAAGALSFAPSKIITTGQGGVVVTPHERLAVRVRELKDHGRAVRGTGGADLHPVFGFNFKLSNVHAAIGLAQLNQFAQRRAHLQQLEAWYREELAQLEPVVSMPPVAGGSGEALAWVDVVADDRDALVRHLRADGIETREFWFPLHTQATYAADAMRFPNATWASSHGLWLPSALSVSREDVVRVGSSLRRFVRDRFPAVAS